MSNSTTSNGYNVKSVREINPDTSLTERERAIRAAAFIDGEGSININRFQVRVCMTSTDMTPLKWMLENYGGSIHRKPGGLGSKTAWDWVVKSALAEQFLKQISPFLLMKPQQAHLALGLRALQGRHMIHVPREEKIALWQPYSDKMKFLNSGKVR